MTTLWVCPHCGLYADDRYALNDVSCFMNAVEYDTDKDLIRYNDNGTRVVGVHLGGK